MAPWATAATHNSALTPPTLWQYPAPVPVQLGPTDHMPLPPVGYQLVRDPITGHLLLIPATNIEHLQRAVLWPSYSATLQPSLHMAAQPTTQHIQLFESTEPSDFLSSLSAAHNHNGTQGQTARILVQPQLTLTATDTPLPKRKGTMIKVESTDCSALEVKTPGMNRQPEVAVTANTAAQVFSGNTSVAHFYYEHPTAVVQLAQTPQPTPAVLTDNGKRSQATSPVNPAETSLTPPPEAASIHLESDDPSNNGNVSGTCGSGDSGAVQVQDASNQTDTPPISEDETGDTNSASVVSSSPQANKASSTIESLALSQPAASLAAAVVTATSVTQSVSTPVVAAVNISEELITSPIPESAHDQKPSSAENILPVIIKPSLQAPMVDVSGLELLSNSIEQFESHRSFSDLKTPTECTSEQTPENVNSQIVNGLLTLSGTHIEVLAEDKLMKPKQEIIRRCINEKTTEALQTVVHQENNIKVETSQSNQNTGNCDNALISVQNISPVSPTPSGSGVEKTEENIQIAASDCELNNNTNGSNLLGGLGLLCALAEQRIMEEGGGNCNNLFQVHSENSKDVVSGTQKNISSESKSNSTSVDVNRNYKTRKSERECKKFIASKVMQYFHQNGNRSGSSSPQHSGVHSTCTSPSSSEIMDAMELDMRMRLAELQRKYREKQRELSKLTPKKTSSSESSNGTAVDTAVTLSTSPTKRGPGRPRKKCNKFNLESPPLPAASGLPTVNGHSKPRVGRPPILKSKDAVNSSKELPPPILEKVTDTRPRSRFDSEDCAAPKLKASKLDILKPPTLTANKVSPFSKFKPATLSCNTKSLKLPQCNVNLVKLNTSPDSNVNDRESGLKSLSESSSKKTSCSILLEEARSKLGSVFSSDKTDKHSAFLSCRLPLVHTACHTFGSKPLSCLPHPGENGHSWFRTSDNILGRIPHTEQDASSVESSDSNTSRKPKSISLENSLLLSSSKKRKVGRPKKHPTGVGFEDATETIVAKKPKSKSSLVGFLLSRSTNPKSDNSLQSSPTSSTSSVSSSPPQRTFGQSLDVSYSGSKTKVSTGGSKICLTNGSSFLTPGNMKIKPNKSDEILDHKPNKIRPKLKAEPKVKSSWAWTEEDDAEGVDWSSHRVTHSQEIPKEEWHKKSAKVDKIIRKSSMDLSRRACKRKLSICEFKSNQTCAKTVKSTLPTEVTRNEAATDNRTANQLKDKESISDQASVAKRHKHNNTNGSSTTSEGEDIPLSTYSAKHNCNSAINCNNNNNIEGFNNNEASSCVLTQAHLNEDKKRVLTVMGGLFYAGSLSAIRAPDVYGITIDGERGNRPHIYSREEILRDAILEVRPSSITLLTPGTRLCAYWSQQYRCLYPGTVAQPTSPDPELDSQFVSVEFDDGDSGRINIDDIRLLPTNYPTLEYDPNPLLSLGKRRRRNSGASCDSHSKDRRIGNEVISGSNTSTSVSSKTNFSSKHNSEENGKSKLGTERTKPSLSEINKCSALKKNGEGNITSKSSLSGSLRKMESKDGTEKSGNLDRTNKERKRLKKRRKEKLKKLLSAAGSLAPDAVLKKRRKKHRCSDEHCKHKKHHKRHRKHKHRHGSRNKDSSSGSSGESSSKSSHGRKDVLTRLSPVLEQLDILEIQQTAIRQLTSGDNTTTRATAAIAESGKSNSSGMPASTGSDEDEADTHCSVPSKAVPPASSDAPSKKKVDSNKTPSSPDTTSIIPTTKSSDLCTPKAVNLTDDSKNDSSAPSIQNASTAVSKKCKKEKECIKLKKHRERQPSVENRSKIAAFLPARQLWGWSGRGFKRPGAKGRGKKEFYKAIQRGKETIMVGDCAVFLSTGRPDRPYIGRIESMWEAWGTNMVVRVKWFYHPEETNGCTVQLKYPGALFESPHVDENDVQTISHKCEVLPLDGYTGRLGTEPERYSSIYDNNDIYYLAGYYDPTTSQLNMKPGVV